MSFGQHEKVYNHYNNLSGYYHRLTRFLTGQLQKLHSQTMTSLICLDITEQVSKICKKQLHSNILYKILKIFRNNSLHYHVDKTIADRHKKKQRL